jgi:cobyrinic acid a,c-diamide synthase
MGSSIPRLVIAGLSGNTGKTIVSLSILSALRRRGFSVSAFKKGPDYIDSAWLSAAAGKTCRNLDTYMVAPRDVLASFCTHAEGWDFSIIEGNRGVFDGKDHSGTHSTAELAKLLDSPTVLVVNAAKATRTLAAMINGCVAFDPDLKIAGVILNRVAGKRHERVIARSIEEYCGLPILGVVPNAGSNIPIIPMRHLGLVTPSEFDSDPPFEARLKEIADEHLDLDGLMDVARSAPQLLPDESTPGAETRAEVRIGFFDDSVFTFYYPENLEALRAAGADLVSVSSLRDRSLPDMDALYIGGGFPETHAEQLTQNHSMMESVREAACDGMPIYAECGGLIYLSESLMFHGSRYPMAGLFPVELEMHDRPVGHGYTLSRVDRDNPFFSKGLIIRGHEFHYSGPRTGRYENKTCMVMESGTGLGHGRDGLLYKNTLACYGHIHADGVRDWAPSMVSLARKYGLARTRGSKAGGGGLPRENSGRMESKSILK